MSGCGVATLSISYYDLGVATGKMAAKILTDPDKGLSGSDRGTLDVSDQLEDGEIRGYFQPYEQPTPTPEPAPEPDPESENAENAEEPPPE